MYGYGAGETGKNRFCGEGQLRRCGSTEGSQPFVPGCGIADVEKAREPLYTTGGEERSGMGFTIMESFMDSLAVRSKNGKGTVVTMKRRIALRTARR